MILIVVPACFDLISAASSFIGHSLQIMVDGHDLKSLQLNWWRSQVALVSQEPALFNDTIYGNIAMSKPGKMRSN